MIQRIIILLTLTLLTSNLFGQPGGGGGLYIAGFYNKQLKEINYNDTSFKTRIFALNDTSINSKITQEILPSNGKSLSPPFSNQRMFIIYNNDSMIIDFFNVMPENGGGNFDYMDSVIFKHGHYRYFRYPNNLSSKVYQEQNLYLLFSNGLTPYTIDNLSKIIFWVFPSDTTPFFKIKFTDDYFLKQIARKYKQSIITYTDIVDVSFLNDVGISNKSIIQQRRFKY
jgi:hypothetical protein